LTTIFTELLLHVLQVTLGYGLSIPGGFNTSYDPSRYMCL